MNKKLGILILIFALGFLIRLIALNQSLWLDEGTTARVIQQFNYSEIITKFSFNDFHPPFYYLFMKLWSNMFGISEISLRLPSVLFSLFSGYFIYLLGGVWSLLFFLFNPLIVYYSQEARMYLMATFFLTGASYYFFNLIKNNNKNKKGNNKNQEIKNIILFNLFIFLSLFTFYGSAFLIIAFLVYFLFKKEYRKLLISVLTILFYSAIISPLLFKQLVNAKVSLQTVTNWSLVLGKANIKNLLLIPLKFSIGRIDFYPKILYWSITGLWTLFVFSQVLIIGLKKRIHFFLFIFPLLLGFIISFFTPLLQYFRFIYLISMMVLILGMSKNKTANVLLLTGFLIFTFSYLLFPVFHREDWKGLSKDLNNNIPIYMITSSSDPLKYYNPNLNIKDIRDIDNINLENHLIVIPNTVSIYGVDYQTILKNRSYKMIKKTSYRELEVEEYFKN